MSKITYTDKVALNINQDVADVNKCNATDMNEIKQVVNENDDNVGDLTQLETTNKNSIVNAINEVNTNDIRKSTYSTSEQVVGKWLDNKPIYRKVVNVNVSSKTSNTIEITISSLDIDTFINISGIVKDNSNLTMALLSDTQAITVEPNNSKIIIYMNNTTAKSYSGHVILEYTKTTD